MLKGMVARDAIVFSTWTWDTFNVPERIALALSILGSRVLYCSMPVSKLHHQKRGVDEVCAGVHVLEPVYLGRKLSEFPLTRDWQWKKVARQIVKQAELLDLKKPVFVYSHVEHMTALCAEMRANGFPLVHICMDYPEPYQYELIALSDQTLVIPKGVFHKLKARFGQKIHQIPQSIHLPFAMAQSGASGAEPSEIASLPHPRLGYLGPIYGRLNLPLLQSVLTMHPDWQFLCFGDTQALPLPSVHSVGWQKPSDLHAYVASFDVGVMPYDCFDEKNLHCAPLKVFDYFLAGLPVVSTPTIPLWEFADLIYFGETAEEFSLAISQALEEPADSPKRTIRTQVARAHSTEALARCLAEIPIFSRTSGRSEN